MPTEVLESPVDPQEEPSFDSLEASEQGDDSAILSSDVSVSSDVSSDSATTVVDDPMMAASAEIALKQNPHASKYVLVRAAASVYESLKSWGLGRIA